MDINVEKNEQDVKEKERYAHLRKLAKLPKITKKNIRFCELYTDINNRTTYGNGMQSAIKAGYGPKCAGANAVRILKNERVRAYIKQLDEATAQKVDINKDRWLVIGFDFLNNFQNENAKVRVWEIIGRCKGFITNELPQDGKQLALFQQIINQAPTDITTGPSDSSSDNINVGNVVEASVVVEDNQTTVEVSSKDS